MVRFETFVQEPTGEYIKLNTAECHMMFADNLKNNCINNCTMQKIIELNNIDIDSVPPYPILPYQVYKHVLDEAKGHSQVAFKRNITYRNKHQPRRLASSEAAVVAHMGAHSHPELVTLAKRMRVFGGVTEVLAEEKSFDFTRGFIAGMLSTSAKSDALTTLPLPEVASSAAYQPIRHILRMGEVVPAIVVHVDI